MSVAPVTGRDGDVVDGIEESVGDDALRAAESAERAALAGGADPLAGLLDRIRAEGPAPAFEVPALHALARMRHEQLPRFLAFVDAACDAAKVGGRRFGRTALRDELDRMHRDATRASRRPCAEETEDAPTGLPVISLGFDLHRITDESIAALATCENLFQRASSLVRIVRAPSVPALDDGAAPAEQRVQKRALRRSPDGGSPIIEGVPAPTMMELLASTAEFRMPDRRARSGARRVLPPTELAARVLARRAYDPLVIRPLVGVAVSPLLLPSGEIPTRPGYHRGSGLYFDLHGPPVEVPERPTRDDARAAAERLAGIFRDFRFQGGEGEQRISVAALLAAILTPLARHAVHGPVPAIMLEADRESAGKTLAARACGAIVLGRAPAARPWSEAEEENRKAIGAIAIAAPPVALIDNVRANVRGGALEALITSEDYADRELGASASIEVPWLTTLYLTGNHARCSPDMEKRLRFVRMLGRGVVAPGEAPGETVRHFEHADLIGHVLEHRPAYLRDALAVLRAHALAGRPPGASLDAFEAWASVVSSAVFWALGADPALAHARPEANTERRASRAVVAAWCVVLRDQPVTLSALRERIAAGEPRLAALRDALADLADVVDLARASSKSIGARLARLAGHPAPAPWGGSMRLEARPGRTGVMVYTATSSTPPPLGESEGRAGPAGEDEAFDHPATPPPFPPREAWPASWRERAAEREERAADGGAPNPAAVAADELRTVVAQGELTDA